MWILYLIVIVVVIIVSILNTNTVKGIWGEHSVDRVLRKVAMQIGGLEMRDFMVRDERSSSQIDNMLLTRKALYVLEVKNYKGMVFGSAHQQNWTVTVKHVNKRRGRGGRVYRRTNISKHPFYNPIKQNQTHINKIINQTTIHESIPIINIVVFCRRAQIKVSDQMPQNTYVATITRLSQLIHHIESRLDQPLTVKDQMAMIDDLFAINITCKIERKQHVKNLKIKHTK